MDLHLRGKRVLITGASKGIGAAAAEAFAEEGCDVMLAARNGEALKALAERLADAGCEFVIEPNVRFEGQPGEQATMFFLDPAGNALEFKAMADPANLFAKN